jgi:RloB-like protein
VTLIPRKPRPLTRDIASLRDDRLFIVACDDTYAPKQYFDFFQLTRVKIHVVPTTDGTSAALHVLNRLLQFDHDVDDELRMLLDTDHCVHGSHIASFMETLREAKRQGVNVALSKPSFELWLLLHHVEETALGALSAATDVEAALRGMLGEYNKTNLKKEHYPPASVSNACVRAERLDATVGGGEIPNDNTTRVYRLMNALRRAQARGGGLSYRGP